MRNTHMESLCLLLSRKCWQQTNWMWTFATRRIDSVRLLKAHGLATHFYLYVKTGCDQCQPYSSILYKCHTKTPWKGCTVSINIIMKPLKINTHVGMHINTYVAHDHGYMCSCADINQCIQMHIRCTSINIDPSIQLTNQMFSNSEAQRGCKEVCLHIC